MISDKEHEIGDAVKPATPEETEERKSVRERLFDIAGWLMIFFQSVPALFIWGGLMTLPFLMYLVIMISSLGTAEVPFVTDRGNLYFWEALDIFLLGGNRIPEKIVSIVGLLILIYSVLHLRFRKPEGLVTTGLYRFVRHPQYLGVVVFSANLTSRCFRETLGDLGWLGSEWTFLLWFGTLIAYIILASVEEIHLCSKFGEQYEEYREKTGFIFPFLSARHRKLEIVITVVGAIMLLFGTFHLAEIMHP